MGLRNGLQADGYEPWVKTSGGKGLHVMVQRPDRKWDRAKVRVWTKRFAEKFAERDPRYTASSTVDREGRLFIDYLRNGRGNTAVGAYSPRARPRLPVSMPVSWPQVARGIRADAYTLHAFIEGPSAGDKLSRAGTVTPELRKSPRDSEEHG